MKAVMTLLVLLVVSSGYLSHESSAEISTNEAFLLEGFGFAVTEKLIRILEIDFGLSSRQQSGSSINFLIEDGFITLGEEEFVVSDLEGKFLREGRYIRINGNVESLSGFNTPISFFGRLVEESADASVYGFTGRITTPDDVYKIIYTAKLSTLSKTTTTFTESEELNDITLYILEGSSLRGIASSYVGIDYARLQAAETQDNAEPLRLRYFSQDRIKLEPGTSITIVNNDLVSHSIISGKENRGDRHVPFTPDGRISSGAIAPGESTIITFDDMGFYRLYDPDYTWMKIVAYVFANSDSLVLGQGQNLGN